ncbi:Uncharacterised protein [Serratia fonticola]|uniref:Uncharacterized protein n=1 Tax=Serratia fonticola TaxID=47917 RepID=A0A4U9V9C0_SERFO|nr:Uncharacterised protein [Serratia fonticola]
MLIRKLGTFVEFSVFKDPVTVDWSIISDRKELDVLGSHLGPYCYPLVIEGIRNGDLPPKVSSPKRCRWSSLLKASP